MIVKCLRTDCNILGDKFKKSSIVFRSMLRRLFKYPPAATSGFTSLMKHFKNAEVILQALEKPSS
jgi:hypothetical protein